MTPSWRSPHQRFGYDALVSSSPYRRVDPAINRDTDAGQMAELGVATHAAPPFRVVAVV